MLATQSCESSYSYIIPSGSKRVRDSALPLLVLLQTLSRRRKILLVKLVLSVGWLEVSKLTGFVDCFVSFV
jgi:hypothetical protein